MNNYNNNNNYEIIIIIIMKLQIIMKLKLTHIIRKDLEEDLNCIHKILTQCFNSCGCSAFGRSGE
jgi:hypothetical protein